MFFCSDKKSICISLKIDAPATGSPGGSTDMSMSEVSRVQGCHYDIANKTNYLLGSTPTSGRSDISVVQKIYIQNSFFICDKYF